MNWAESRQLDAPAVSYGGRDEVLAARSILCTAHVSTARLRHAGISWHGPCRYALAQQNEAHEEVGSLLARSGWSGVWLSLGKPPAEKDTLSAAPRAQVEQAVRRHMDNEVGPDQLAVALDAQGASALQVTRKAQLCKDTALALNRVRPTPLT